MTFYSSRNIACKWRKHQSVFAFEMATMTHRKAYAMYCERAGARKYRTVNFRQYVFTMTPPINDNAAEINDFQQRIDLWRSKLLWH